VTSPRLPGIGKIARQAREPLVVCLLGLTALSPLVKPTLPRSFDGMFHLFRLLEIHSLMRDRVFFPRWAPDLFYGYGFPVFDFVPHLPYYISSIPHLLGLDLVHTVLTSFGLSLIASGVAMYVFVRDIFGDKAALVAAAAYMYAPFHLYDMLFRGHLPGSWSLVIYPLVLWSFRRLIVRGGTGYLVLGASLYTASFLTHNPAHVIFTPFLVFYVAVLGALTARDRAAAVLRVTAAVLLGIGLSAFFWIPALWDRQYIQLDRFVAAPELDYRSHFIGLGELLAPPPTAQTGRMNPGVPNSLGPVLVALSLLSVVGLRRLRGRGERIHIIVFLCALAGVLFMVSPQSAVVWETVPLLQYLVFPHRFLRLGILVMAVLSGTVTRLFTDDKAFFTPSFLVALATISLIVLTATPLLYPPYYSSLPLNPSFADMMEFERKTGTMGTTSFGEYLPVWVEWVPESSPLEAMYRRSAAIERFDQSNLPEGTKIDSVQYGPLSATVHLRASHATELTYTGLYFPGWQAYVDGVDTPLSPTVGLGLMSLTLPAGEHVVELRFADTIVRAASEALSLFSVAVLAALCAFSLIKRRAAHPLRWLSGPGPSLVRHGQSSELSGPQASALVGAALLLALLKVGIVDVAQTPFKRDFDGQYVQQAQHSLQVNFGDQLTLLGYDLDVGAVHPGQELLVTLYWKAQQQLPEDYSAFVHLVDEQMNIYGQKDSLNPGGYPTHLWPVDEYNQDRHRLLVPPGTPPGQYLVGIGLYNPETMMRVPILADEGHESGMYFLQSIAVQRADRPPSVEELGIDHPLELSFENGMTLLGFTTERETLTPGDFYRVALFWEAEESLDNNYVVALRLLNADGDELLLQQSEPSAGRFPTTRWEAAEIVRDNHALWIPSDFPSGEYELRLAVLDPRGGVVDVATSSAEPGADGWITLLSLPAGR
jgi:hypothetical protein